MEQEKLIMNGVEVKLKNPGTRGLKDILVLSKDSARMDPAKNGTDFAEHISDRGMDALTNLVNLTLEKTFPEVTDEIDAWAMENNGLLITKIMEMCSPKQSQHEQDKIERLKALQQK